MPGLYDDDEEQQKALIQGPQDQDVVGMPEEAMDQEEGSSGEEAPQVAPMQASAAAPGKSSALDQLLAQQQQYSSRLKGLLDQYQKNARAKSIVAGITDALGSAPSWGEFYLGRFAPRGESQSDLANKQNEDALKMLALQEKAMPQASSTAQLLQKYQASQKLANANALESSRNDADSTQSALAQKSAIAFGMNPEDVQGKSANELAQAIKDMGSKYKSDAFAQGRQGMIDAMTARNANTAQQAAGGIVDKVKNDKLVMQNDMQSASINKGLNIINEIRAGKRTFDPQTKHELENDFAAVLQGASSPALGAQDRVTFEPYASKWADLQGKLFGEKANINAPGYLNQLEQAFGSLESNINDIRSNRVKNLTGSLGVAFGDNPYAQQTLKSLNDEQEAATQAIGLRAKDRDKRLSGKTGGQGGGANPNVKVLNGVTYHKVPGGWRADQ